MYINILKIIVYISGLLENSVAVTRESLCIVEVGQRTMTRVLVHMTNDISLLLSALGII